MEQNTHSYFSYEDKKGEEWRCNGVLHREDGPARIYSNGTKQYYKHGILHRENGPAIEANHNYCMKYVYYINGEMHNINNPAYRERWQDCEILKYFQHNELHHLQGPAIIIKYFTKNKKNENHYYINNIYYTVQKFEKVLNTLKKFIHKLKQRRKYNISKTIHNTSIICFDISKLIASYCL